MNCHSYIKPCPIVSFTATESRICVFCLCFGGKIVILLKKKRLLGNSIKRMCPSLNRGHLGPIQLYYHTLGGTIGIA